MKNIIKILFLTLFSITFSSCNEDETPTTPKQEPTIVSANKIASDSNSDIEMRIDPKVTKDNSIVFDTKEEAEQFVTDLKKELEQNSSLTYRCAPGIYSGTAWTTGFTSLIFDVSVGENGCIGGITGQISGVGIPYSWSGGATTFGCTSGSACGMLNINIFYEGLGTIYSIHQCYSISLSC